MERNLRPAEEVAAAYAAWDQGFNQRVASSVAAAYLPDAKLLPPTHTIIAGHRGIEEFFGGLFANGVTDHKLV